MDAEGNPVTGDLDKRLFTVELGDLKKMTGFLVVSGASKINATAAALRGGYANRLVIDEALAKSVIDLGR